MPLTKHNPRWRIPGAIEVWLIFLAVLGLMFAGVDLFLGDPFSARQQALVAAVWATILLGVWMVLRWIICEFICGPCDRRKLIRFLGGTAILATAIALFYLEEDWRGKRVWTACRAQLESKDIIMDWDKYLPPPIPEDQNFFAASTNILLRFKKAQTPEERRASAHLQWLRLDPPDAAHRFPIFDNSGSRPLVVARFTVVSPADGHQESALALADAETPAKVRDIIRGTVGRTATGAMGYEFSELRLSDLRPAEIQLQAGSSPSVAELEGFIPSDLATNLGKFGFFQIKPAAGKDQFELLLTGLRVTAAADYLKWSDPLVPALDELRAALKRPCAVLPGDYSLPYQNPIANFVAIRGLAQTLTQRAQCDLLLNQPEAALREMTLLHDVCRILQKPPTGKPETLVEAMINVAVNGLFAATVADGFRLQAWREPQMAALQQQLQTVNLLRFVAEAFRDEVAASAHTLELSMPRDLQTIDQPTATYLWDKLSNPRFWFLKLAPGGWYYQNMAFAARLSGNIASSFDVSDRQIQPSVFDRNAASVENALSHWSLWSIWARMAIPNFSKAAQTTACNQTRINEAQIACALERYRLAHGEYPDTLDALVPLLMVDLPRDVIGDQPLHYRRTGDGKFVLYSVGWNGLDDGGLDSNDLTKGDWAWKP